VAIFSANLFNRSPSWAIGTDFGYIITGYPGIAFRNSGGKMKLAKIVLAILLIAALFSACGRSGVRPTESPTPSITAKTSTPPADQGLFPTILARQTNIALSTETSQAATAYFLDQKQLSEIETENVAGETMASVTQASIATSLAPFPNRCDSIVFLKSPDGNWLAQDCEMENMFIVTDRGGTRHWSITNDQIFGPPDESNPDNSGSLHPVHWSADGQLVYFEVHECCGGDGADLYEFFGMPILGAFPIDQLDTRTGTWTNIIPSANYYSFSPTGRRVMYFTRTSGDSETANVIVHVMDLKTGQVFDKILGEYPAAGYAIWSPDGKRFAFTAIHRGLDWPNFTVSLFEMQADSGELSLLYTFAPSNWIYSPIVWDSQNILTIHATTYSNDPANKIQYFDVNKTQLLDETTTPTATP
jgi:hypothetical protein